MQIPEPASAAGAFRNQPVGSLLEQFTGSLDRAAALPLSGN
jgi:hypothetical protein